jgi:hypothetical protein
VPLTAAFGPDAAALLDMALALVLGGAIGWERKHAAAHQPPTSAPLM